MRGAGPDAVVRRALLGRGDDARVGGEPEIVVAAEMQDLSSVGEWARALRRIDDPSAAQQLLHGTLCKRGIELRDQTRHRFDRAEARSRAAAPPLMGVAAG